MAHAAQLSGLTDELVEIIAGYSPTRNASAFRACKDSALKSLKSHRFGRTNQFNVRSSLEGLVEKFDILNRDILAEQLGSRLVDLDKKSYRWKPEVLSLLLLLSDRPAEKTAISAVQELEVVKKPPALTWNDILVDDPITDKNLWRDIYRRHPDTSEDETLLDHSALSDYTEETSLSTTPDDDHSSSPELLVLSVDTAIISRLQQTAQRHEKPTLHEQTLATELQTLREVLHGLLGLPTNIFQFDDRNGRKVTCSAPIFGHVSTLSLDNLLSSFAVMITDMEVMRIFCRKSEVVPLLQTFAGRVSQYVQDFDAKICKIEQRYVGIKEACVVSLLDVFYEIEVYLGSMHAVTEIIAFVENLTQVQSFRLLDELFDRACLSDALGGQKDFGVIADIFLDCLRTYLEPLNQWMEDGYLNPDDLLCPFLLTNTDDDEKFWSECYVILEVDSTPQVPRFLQRVLPEIFASGKDIALTRALGMGDTLASLTKNSQTGLDFQEILRLKEISISPFSALLDDALLNWVSSKRQQTWNQLQDHIFQRCGLWRTITGLGVIYFSSDGYLTEAFSEALFTKINANNSDWDEPAFVQELARETFGLCQSIGSGQLYARRDSTNPSQRPPQQHMSVKSLANIVLQYKCPWPIENIIPPSTMKTYQNVFTILLQINRAKSLLSDHNLHVLSSLNKLAKSQTPKDEQENSIFHHHLRHRLHWLVATLNNYMFNCAIAPTSLELRREMQAATNIDALILAHSRFIFKIEQDCLLVKEMASTHGALLSLLDLCILFANLDTHEIMKQRKDIDLAGHDLADGSAAQLIHKSKQFRQITNQYHKLLEYAITGLRGAARAQGATPRWEVLAEMLELGVWRS